MAYDRADWHSGGDFPSDVPDENGGTHIGIFLAWAIMNGLAGKLLLENSPQMIEAVKARRMTGRELLFQACDGKFWNENLSDEGNRFAKNYYSDLYFDDYTSAIGQTLPTMYHARDTWQNYDKVAAVISKRFALWRRTGSIKAPWWKFREVLS